MIHCDLNISRIKQAAQNARVAASPIAVRRRFRSLRCLDSNASIICGRWFDACRHFRRSFVIIGIPFVALYFAVFGSFKRLARVLFDIAARDLSLDFGKKFDRFDCSFILFFAAARRGFVKGEQVGHIARLEKSALFRILEHFTRQEFLINLPVIYLLLDRARGDEPVDRHFLLLPDSPRTFARLRIRGRIPIGIVQQHAIRPR